jgi:hypothetical protein
LKICAASGRSDSLLGVIGLRALQWMLLSKESECRVETVLTLILFQNTTSKPAYLLE